MCSGRQTKTNDCRAPHIAVHRIEDAVGRLWGTEHAKWNIVALPELRRGLIEHLRTLRDDSNRNTSALQRRVDKVKRDRYKWAEQAMDGTVPADIAREKQEALARQLVGLEGELNALTAAGDDTEATLNGLIELITEPGHTYGEQVLGLRRTYNQAWFTRIYIDAVSDDPTDELDITGERTLIADALEGSRQLTLATLDNSEAGPVGPAELFDLGIQ